jgi:dihydrofolate reductase
MILSVVAAVAENGVIGRGNRLPWRLPLDLRRFKELTWGHPLIMGRLTFESIGRPLPGRVSVVLSRDAGWDPPPGVRRARTFAEALASCGEAEEAFVVGGEAVYRLALPLAHRLHLTLVHGEVDGDRHFPSFSPDDWHLVEEESHPADDRHAYPFTFRTYHRS